MKKYKCEVCNYETNRNDVLNRHFTTDKCINNHKEKNLQPEMIYLRKQNPDKFAHAKLYRIVNTVDDKYYIGATTDTLLSKRLTCHKSNSKKYSDRAIYQHLNKIGWDKAHIILIKEIHVQNRKELFDEEDKLIQTFRNDHNCLNMIRSSLTKEEGKQQKNIRQREYYRETIDERVEYDRIRNQSEKRKQENKERCQKFFQKEHIKINCQCGNSYYSFKKSEHFKSKHHQMFIQRSESQ